MSICWFAVVYKVFEDKVWCLLYLGILYRMLAVACTLCIFSSLDGSVIRLYAYPYLSLKRSFHWFLLANLTKFES
jgi:hypothetical protein